MTSTTERFGATGAARDAERLPGAKAPGPEELVAFLRGMTRIRMVELEIESRYHLDEMKTPVHLCIGQEAIAVGVCAALRRDDYISSNHRSHGHYLAKGGDLKALIAELHCRLTGCAKGRGGSMHLVDTSVGHLGSSAIVGGGIPIAVGLALACRMKALDRISVAFFGDGAADEGVLYESINFAVLKKLPVVFVLEDNGFSVCSRVSARRRGPVVFHEMDPGLLFTASVDGNDVLEVYDAAVRSVARARAGGGPSFIECATYRVRGHAGSGSDARLGYRTEEEIKQWEDKRCPVKRFKERLLADGIVTGKDLERMTEEIGSGIREAFDFALSSPLPEGEDVCRYVFRE